MRHNRSTCRCEVGKLASFAAILLAAKKKRSGLPRWNLLLRLYLTVGCKSSTLHVSYGAPRVENALASGRFRKNKLLVAAGVARVAQSTLRSLLRERSSRRLQFVSLAAKTVAGRVLNPAARQSEKNDVMSRKTSQQPRDLGDSIRSKLLLEKM